MATTTTSTSTTLAAATTSTAPIIEPGVSLYPSLSIAQVEATRVNARELPDSFELVQLLADEFLEMEVAEAMNVAEGTDVEGWTVSNDVLDIAVRAEILAWQDDGDIVWGITRASSFDDDEGFFLSADVREIDGVWTAMFVFPTPDSEAGVTFAAGDWEEVSDNTATGEITLELPSEPMEPPRFMLIYYDNQTVTGIHAIDLPAGAFAAG